MDLQLKNWTENDYNSFLEYLKAQADEKYRKFHSSLVPGAENDYILGVRMPILREMGKQISKGNPKSFLSVSSDKFYEERMLRGIVTGLVKTDSFDDLKILCEGYIDEIDNWALCDCFCAGLKQISRYKKEFFEYINAYLACENVWKVRTGLVIMLDYYLDDEYIERVFERTDNINSDFYYVNMAQAWLVATAFAKCREAAMKYIKNNNLNKFTFNKAIQKCIESRRIDDATKCYLKTLKY